MKDEKATVSFPEMMQAAGPLSLAFLQTGQNRAPGPLELMLAFELARRILMRMCEAGMTPDDFVKFEREVERVTDTLDTAEEATAALVAMSIKITATGGSA
jgi:hypothetical protein